MTAHGNRVVLISETQEQAGVGRWQFVVGRAGGVAELSASDVELDMQGERLELLAVVRGLEALDQPSRVTLVTSSRYVNHGIQYGLDDWRENNWQWECFGELVPVKNADLWQRIDRALQFHRVECRSLRIDRAHSPLAPKLPSRHVSVQAACGESSLAGPHCRRRETPGRAVSREKQRNVSRFGHWLATLCELATAWKPALFPRPRLG